MKRSEIEQLLPQIFQRTVLPGTPLFDLLELMENLHQDAEALLASLDNTFNPRRAPDDFVPYLAGWVDLDRLFGPSTKAAAGLPGRALSTGLGRLRELAANAAGLSKWRGTASGLLRFLRIATGEQAFHIIENRTHEGESRLYHMLVFAPPSLRAHSPLLERIINSEKPAYLTYELFFEPAPGTHVNPKNEENIC